jgi:hypothetical protein
VLKLSSLSEVNGLLLYRVCDKFSKTELAQLQMCVHKGEEAVGCRSIWSSRKKSTRI